MLLIDIQWYAGGVRMKKGMAMLIFLFLLISRSCIFALGSEDVGKEVSASETDISEPLTIQGGIPDMAYRDFIGENPDIAVKFSDTIWTPDEISQAVAGGDETADLYLVHVSNAFKALTTKGYAADMSASSILTADIDAMYPFVKKAITDAQGHPVAYPYLFYLDKWQVNEGLWRLAFGEDPLPRTFEEFVDGMLRWESELADQYPEIDFVMNFDYAYWTEKIITAYIQQYERENEFLDINQPALKRVLEKLEQVSIIRAQNKKPNQFVNGDEWIPKPEIFITAGLSSPITDATAPMLEIRSTLYHGVNVDHYTDMQPLLFQEGDPSFIPGRMLVWIINPLSQNKNVALQYLEYVARMNNNPRVYYATHPDINEPLENAGYQIYRSELQMERDALQEALKSAEGTEKLDTEDMLSYVESQLEDAESGRWMISEKGISSYRAIAPTIRLFEDLLYIAAEGSALQRQLAGVYQRFAEGRLTLDAFLQELNSKMRMVYLEGR